MGLLTHAWQHSSGALKTRHVHSHSTLALTDPTSVTQQKQSHCSGASGPRQTRASGNNRDRSMPVAPENLSVNGKTHMNASQTAAAEEDEEEDNNHVPQIHINNNHQHASNRALPGGSHPEPQRSTMTSEPPRTIITMVPKNGLKTAPEDFVVPHKKIKTEEPWLWFTEQATKHLRDVEEVCEDPLSTLAAVVCLSLRREKDLRIKS
ncbi:hypothetical protein WMY93_018066 [Mugilogobius chulae]|uniref:Uncharacterized protein n=1 Tax=Mugilogobius chulae TaxID=88201 RepID=A0AAW0NTR7_9GOBI